MQPGGGGGLAVAQFRKLGGHVRLFRGAARRVLGQLRHLALDFGEMIPGLLEHVLGGFGLKVQRDGLGAANLIGDVAVAGRLAGLFLEPVELGFQGRDHVVQALQVGLCRAQAQLRLVAARVQPGDAGGFLQQRAAGGRLGVDQRADPALTDQRRRMRARSRIRE